MIGKQLDMLVSKITATKETYDKARYDKVESMRTLINMMDLADQNLRLEESEENTSMYRKIRNAFLYEWVDSFPAFPLDTPPSLKAE